MDAWWFVPLGLAIGALGTLIGAGGGFILMPILLLLFPDVSPERLTAVSLAVVFLNAASGTVAYIRMRRVHFRAGIQFALASLPGALLGVWVNGIMPRQAFAVVLGVFLVALALYLLAKTRKVRPATHGHDHGLDFAYDRRLGIIISAGVGFLSSLLGIGGGIIHVPALVYALGFAAHVATATSHFVLAFTALAATIVHAANGDLTGSWLGIGELGIGVIVGAQLGAGLSTRIHGVWIIRCLAGALLLVAVRVLVTAL